MKKFFTQKVALKVGTFLMFVIAVSFVTMAWMSYSMFSKSLENATISDIRSQTQNFSTILSEQLNVYKAKITEISMNNVIKTMDWSKQITVLENEVSVNGFMKMGVADPSGNITYTNNSNINISKREYFIAALGGEVFISDPLLSAAENKMVVVFACPIKGSNGSVEGILTATVDGQFLSTLCKSITIGESGYGFILNSQGTTIGDLDEEHVYSGYNTIKESENDGSLKSLSVVENKMIKGNTGVDTYDKSGSEQYLGYTPITGTSWTLGITVSRSELLSSVEKLKFQVILFTVIMMAAIIILFDRLMNIYISKPLKKVVRIADNMAEGDYTHEITAKELKKSDEIGKLTRSFDKIINNFNSTMGNINAASNVTAAGARKISDTSTSLSEGASEQSSTIEQLTASIEEISSQIQINAENAENASKYTDDVRINAVAGNDRMHSMLNAMEEINTSSNDISKIIKVIDDIAFQTNILALNAAVEAARAGEYGKGFAVVAEEVRNLAAKSARAAKDTSNLIENSIKKVDDGLKIAKETSDDLTTITQGISKAAQLIINISSASKEQSMGLAQINQGIMQVSEVVQINSANAEQCAAASEGLSDQATKLREQIAVFKIKKSTEDTEKEGASNKEYAAVSESSSLILSQSEIKLK